MAGLRVYVRRILGAIDRPKLKMSVMEQYDLWHMATDRTYGFWRDNPNMTANLQALTKALVIGEGLPEDKWEEFRDHNRPSMGAWWTNPLGYRGVPKHLRVNHFRRVPGRLENPDSWMFGR